jgi:peptidyl-prolyl cis-trans isomerase SurA
MKKSGANLRFPRRPPLLRCAALKTTLVRLLSACLLAVPALAQDIGYVNGIVAVVNDAVVTKRDVEIAAEGAIELSAKVYGSQPEVFAKKRLDAIQDAADQLIERQLILRDFSAGGYNFPEAILDEAVKDRIRAQFGDRITLTRTLKAQGMTFEGYRQRVREQLIIEGLRARHVSQELIISPHKIETYYATNQSLYQLTDEVKLRMIALKSGGLATARKIAGEIQAKVRTGTAFAEMASVYHEGTQPGGDWGWVERKILAPALAEAAFTLKPGETSGPIELGDAVFLLHVEDRRAAHTRPLADVREEIEKELVLQEQNRLHKKWIDRLKAKTFLRYY